MKIEPFKMEVTPEQSRQVQEIVFRNGGRWKSGLDTVQYEDAPFLYFNDNTLQKDEKRSRNFFEGFRLPLITFADFMSRYGGAETPTHTQFDTMRKIVTIAEEAHKNGDAVLCSVLLDALSDYLTHVKYDEVLESGKNE